MHGAYAKRNPHRKRRSSGAGLTKLALIKSRCGRAIELSKKVRVDANTQPAINLFDLDNLEAILETIIDLCEQESIDNDDR